VRKGLTVLLRFEDDRAERELKIAHVRAHKRLMIVRFTQIQSADDAQELFGAEIWTDRENAALAEGEYLDADLIGCTLVQSERTIGRVATVRHYPAQAVLELEGGSLVPLVRAFVRDIDVRERIIRVELPPGLVEGETL
ncbi:MAG: ribosome maturation factor RimM, partial [Vulcanimicrobiaceae bacterium]